MARRTGTKLLSYCWGGRPKGIPLTFWTEISWYRRVVLLLAALTPWVLASWLITGLYNPGGTFFFAFALLFVHGVPKVVKRRMYRKVAACDFLVCLDCGYHLRCLSERRCPECGTPFDPNEIKAKWLNWFGKASGSAHP